MTTPTTSPLAGFGGARVLVPAAPAVPAGYGLLAAATVTAAPEHAEMVGLTWVPNPCTPANAWPTGCSTVAPPADGKVFYDRDPDNTADPFAVYWAEQCATIPGLDAARARAGLAQGESRAVETAVWAAINANNLGGDTDPNDLEAARGLVDCVGHLEEELGNRTGTVGVIHAPRRVLAHAHAAMMAIPDGPVYRTPGGHVWAFGSGYSTDTGNPPADGARLVATGPFFLQRTDVMVFGPIVDHLANAELVLAERVYLAGWDCAAVGMTTPLSY